MTTPLFVEKLTIPALARLAPRLLAGGASCWFVDATRAAEAAAGFLRLPARKLEFRMMEVRDENGLMARLRIPFEDLDSIVRRIMESSELTAPPLDLELRPYMAKSVAVSGEADGGDLWRALYLIQVAAWAMRRDGTPRAVFALRNRPWRAQIEEYAARHGMDLLWLGQVTRARMKSMAGLFAGPTLVNRLLATEPRGAVAAAPRRGPPSLGVEFYSHLNLDRPALQSDLAFWQRSRIPASRMLALFGIPHSPLDAPRLDELRRHGLDGLAVIPAAARGAVPVFRTKRARHHRPRPFSGWRREREARFKNSRAFWRELFEEQNLRVLLSWYKFDASHHAATAAMRDVGGVSAIYQRAFQTHPSPSLAVDIDVHFSFSPAFAAIPRADGSRLRYNIATGYPGDHLFELVKPGAAKRREELAKHGARRVIAFFDEGSAEDERWQTGHGLQRTNYSALLEMVLADDELGLIIKPKVPTTLRERLGPVSELLAAAEKTGRCFVYETGEWYAAHCPAEGALASDLVVHGHLNAGTAAVESALAGVPTVMLDYEGWPRSPLYRLGVGRCVFPDWDALRPALAEHWRRPQGLPGFGDWSSLLPEIDPYRDGRAAERIGDFLHWTLEGLENGGPERALDDAAERFAAAWGPDKVARISPSAGAGLEAAAR